MTRVERLIAVLLMAAVLFGVAVGVANAAVIYYNSAGVDNNWTTAANWWEDDLHTLAHGAVPSATTDTVKFTAATVTDCIINDNAATCKAIDFTGYVDSVFFNKTLTVAGDVTLEGDATYAAGTGGKLIIDAQATYTDDAVALAVPFVFGGGSFTGLTFQSDCEFAAGFEITGTSFSDTKYIDGGKNITISGGDFTISVLTTGSIRTRASASTFIFTGSSTISSSQTTGALNQNITIDAPAGDIVWSGQFNTSRVLKYTTAASVTTTGSTLVLLGAAGGLATLNTANMNGVGAIDMWNDVQIGYAGAASSSTVELQANFNVAGDLTIIGSTGVTREISGAYNLNVGGDFTISGITTGSVLGTTTIVMNGSGTITNSLTSGSFANPLTINTAGDIVFAAQNFNYGGTGSILTYTTANSVTTTGSTLRIVGTATINTANMVETGGIDKWNDVQIGLSGVAGFTTTLSSDLNVADDLLITGSTTAAHVINGAYNLNVGGDFTISDITTGSVLGTTTIVMNGSGTINTSLTTGTVSNPFTVVTAGNYAFTAWRSNSIDFTGSNGGTMTFNGEVNIAGSVTLEGDVTYAAGAGGALTVSATATLTADGATLPCSMTLAGTSTINLADNWDVNGSLTIASSSTVIFGSLTSSIKSMNVSGGLTTNSYMGQSTYGCIIVMDGTGTISSASSALAFQLSITINTAGTITLGNFTLYTGTFKYITGTIAATGKARLWNCTINSSGMTGANAWDDVLFGTAGAVYRVTLTSDMYINGSLTIGDYNVGTYTVNGDYDIYVANGLSTNSLTTCAIGGAVTIVLQGGSLSMSSITTGYLGMNIQIAGDVTIGDIAGGKPNVNVGGDGKSLTYVSGTEVTTNSNVVVKVGTYTITMNAAGFGFSGLRLQGATTFAGTEGFNVKYLESSAGLSHTFASGEEVTVSDSLKFVGSSASRILLASSTPDAVAYLTFNGYRAQSVYFTNPTDINSANGGYRGRIYDVGGVIDNSANWYARYTPPMLAAGGGQSFARSKARWGRFGKWGGR